MISLPSSSAGLALIRAEKGDAALLAAVDAVEKAAKGAAADGSRCAVM